MLLAPKHFVLRFPPLCLVLFIGLTGRGQSTTAVSGARIELLHTDELSFDNKMAPGAQRLIGNVRFMHEGATMRCDSAYFFDKRQVINAFGHVAIDQSDTLHISGDRLDYDGATHAAVLGGSVHLSDKDMDLTAPNLSYDTKARVATYSGGGTLVSRKEGNTLTSGKGSYIAATHQFRFHDDVVLRAPDRTITSDSLYYTSTTGVAEFIGPTTIISGTTRMWCTRGTYDTRNDRGRFTRRARVLADGQELQGDSLHYDRKSGEGLAWGHVLLTDTANGLVVRGDEGRHTEKVERSMVTGHAEMELRMGQDTLWLHGDTLLAVPDGVKGRRRITALHRIRFFKSDLQGACDTMIYADADSVIHLLHAPVLWSAKDQITGDRMQITLLDGKAHRLFVDGSAFITSQVDSIHFDQVTGTTLTGYFNNGEIDHLITDGNCRTVYFAREGPKEAERLTGVNRADCSTILVKVRKGEVDVITFLTKPDGVYYPIAKAPAGEMVLKGLAWRGGERPADRSAIME